MNLLVGTFEERLRKSISFAWHVFMEKTGSELLVINKEASMQLQYSYILQQVVPLICFDDNEKTKIELETGVRINNRTREIDLILDGYNSQGCRHRIAVEMKCYREFSSSGGKRGATDIFMKDVYEDLGLLEEYCDDDDLGFSRGVALVMNDLERLVNPKRKDAKCWDYDTSHGTKVGNKCLTTPIGGKEASIELKKSYEFKWIKKGSFWFLENEGL